MEKISHLYRLRVLFDENDAPTLVETVTKSVIADGDARHPAGEAVATFDPALVDQGMLRAFLAHLDEVGAVMRKAAAVQAASDAERTAAVAKTAADAAEKAASESMLKAEEAKAAAEAAQTA